MDLAVHSNQSEKKTRMARCVVMAVDGKHLLLTERASLSGPRADSGPVSAAAGSTKTKKKKSVHHFISHLTGVIRREYCSPVAITTHTTILDETARTAGDRTSAPTPMVQQQCKGRAR
jgi:hypothetical protein